MIRNTGRFSNGEYDIIVIGGGINGAGVANLASSKGLKVALLEKNDFSSGTSSKSTKLVHGGLRYLENFEFKLVYEALSERAVQLRAAPHLVKPLEFIIPVYKDDKRPLWMVRMGVALYDLLSARHMIGRRNYLAKKNIISSAPDLIQDDLVGGVSYFDAQMDDARLCLENVMQADLQGAHVANYIEVKELIKENGRTVGVKAYDKIENKYLIVKGKNIVSAVGPWANDFLLKEKNQGTDKVRPTKGVHIIYKGRFSDKAILLPNDKDGRVFFVIPWGRNTLIGTTDTDFKGSVDDVRVDDEDIAYLINATQKYFPERTIDQSNIISSFAGLRPLVHKVGTPSKVSREHVIETSFSGIHYIMGGKYTTYRKIAEDCIKVMYGNGYKFSKDEFKVYGGGKVAESIQEIAKRFGVAEDIVDHVVGEYGNKYEDVLKIARDDEKMKMRLQSNTDIVHAQIIYAKTKEMAQTADDVYFRRLGFRYVIADEKNVLGEIEKLIN